MDNLRTALSLFPLLLLSAGAAATPVDTAYDFLYAIETADGEALLDTFSESLGLQITTRLEQLRELALADQSIEERVLLRLGIDRWELEHLDTYGLLGRLVTNIRLNPAQTVLEEQVSMTGRDAEVTLWWPDGGSVTFTMTWEEGSWKITSTGLLISLFR